MTTFCNAVLFFFIFCFPNPLAEVREKERGPHSGRQRHRRRRELGPTCCPFPERRARVAVAPSHGASSSPCALPRPPLSPTNTRAAGCSAIVGKFCAYALARQSGTRDPTATQPASAHGVDYSRPACAVLCGARRVRRTSGADRGQVAGVVHLGPRVRRPCEHLEPARRHPSSRPTREPRGQRRARPFRHWMASVT